MTWLDIGQPDPGQPDPGHAADRYIRSCTMSSRLFTRTDRGLATALVCYPLAIVSAADAVNECEREVRWFTRVQLETARAASADSRIQACRYRPGCNAGGESAGFGRSASRSMPQTRATASSADIGSI